MCRLISSRSGRTLLTGALLLLLPALVRSAPTLPHDSGVPTLRDARLAMNARRALLQDERLAPLNLGISVRQGVGTIWGPVPSEEAARLALARVREVKGLLEVRSQLYVARMEEPPPHRPSPNPPFMPLEPLQPGALMGRPGDNTALPGDTLKHPRRPGVHSAPLGAEARPARPVAESVSLLAPVAVADTTPPSSSAEMALAVEQLRLGDARFHLLRPQVQDGIVSLQGAARWDDAYEFAERVARLSGVKRVVMGPIEPRLR